MLKERDLALDALKENLSVAQNRMKKMGDTKRREPNKDDFLNSSATKAVLTAFLLLSSSPASMRDPEGVPE